MQQENQEQPNLNLIKKGIISVLENPSKDPNNTIATLQRALGILSNTVVASSDEFDDATRNAVKTFQENNGLEPTGIPDDKTLSVIIEEIKKKNF